MNKVLTLIKQPLWILVFLNNRGIHLLSDKKYISLLYKLTLKKKLNLENPQTFNEKLQWLKLYDRKPEYTKMVDKYEVREIIKEKIGKEYLIPLIGVYDNFNDIDFDKLPNQFVLKCTHDSGSVIICKDKAKFNIKKARKKINKCLKKNFFYSNREWPYKNVKPRIIIEKYMEDDNQKSIRDYKFFCFNGKPEIMYISEGLENHQTASMSFFDMQFQLNDCKRKDFKLLEYKPKKPKNFEKMKSFSSLLSKDIPHVRVDFYEINGKLFFGELTFFTCSGFVPFEDEKWNKKLGDLLKLEIVS